MKATEFDKKIDLSRDLIKKFLGKAGKEFLEEDFDDFIKFSIKNGYSGPRVNSENIANAYLKSNWCRALMQKREGVKVKSSVVMCVSFALDAFDEHFDTKDNNDG